MSFRFQSWLVALLSLLVAGSVSIGTAAGPAIGVVKASGSFRVDDAAIYRSGTLFAGNVIDVESVPSEAWLDGGARLRLSPGSRCQVYQDRLLLEKGASQVMGGDHYAVETRGLRVLGSGPTAEVRVSLNPAGHVEVAALGGAAQVWSARGFLVANVLPGSALDLDSQGAEADSGSRLTGCLRKKSGKFILTDETTNVTAELRGAGLSKEVGKVVEVRGPMKPDAKAAAGATQVIQVSELKPTGRKCSVSGKAAAGAGAAAGAAGMSTGTIVAIVGGVAAVGTASGLAIRATSGGEQQPLSP
jgi:hypothetical protein